MADGLSNQLKFYGNTKPETQLLAEAMELPYCRDDYNLPLSEPERKTRQQRRDCWSQGRMVLGINTGCSSNYPNKKLTVQFHRALICAIRSQFNFSIVLLGGPEDEVRNQQLPLVLMLFNRPQIEVFATDL
jgi:hypothetical protein